MESPRLPAAWNLMGRPSVITSLSHTTRVMEYFTMFAIIHF